jgi:hypothetical protein
MENTFGKIKSKLLQKLTESYETNKKDEIKNILSIIKEDKDFSELYLFYDDVENLELSYPGSAELYVETIQPLLNEKSKSVSQTCKKLSNYLNDVDVETNHLYENLDILSEPVTLNNVDKKVMAKKKLIEHLETKKEIVETKQTNYTANEKLLLSFLSNDFNSYFSRTLSEEDKTKLKQILKLNKEELVKQSNQLSEEILQKVQTILTESTDEDLKDKLKNVQKEVQNITPTKYNYYKLLELKNGLD